MTVILALLALLAVGGFVLYQQWTATPAHVAKVRQWLQQTTEEERDQLARQVEMRLPTAYTRRIEPGTDGTRTLEATYEEINAWLGQRLESYLDNQGVAMPNGVGAVMVHERGGKVVVAADVNLPQLSQIVSVFLALHPPAQDENAAASDEPAPWSVTVDKATAGNIPLPTGRLIEMVRDQLPADTLARPRVKEMLDAVAQGQPIPLPRLKVDRTRRAEILDVAVSEIGVTVELRVFIPGPADKDTPAAAPVMGPTP